jgi:hypothetical protein
VQLARQTAALGKSRGLLCLAAQAGVFDGQRRLVGHAHGQLDLLLRELPDLAVIERDPAVVFVLDDQRYGQEGREPVAQHQLDLD